MLNIVKLLQKYNIYFFFIILLLLSFSHEENEQNNYFFTIYPSADTNTSFIIHSFTPYSEHLTIDFSQENPNKIIQKESIADYSNKHSSTFFYSKDYLIKTCFGANKIVEIIPVSETEKKYEEIKVKYVYSIEGINIAENIQYCFSTIITNPDKASNKKDENIIITYWVQILDNNNYSHKVIFFYPNSKKFSKVYPLYSNFLFPLEKRFPIHCTVFRNSDIFCSYYDLDLNNQYVIETNKIMKENAKTPSVHFVLSDFGQINGKNMLPISLNKQLKSIFGGYYDIFLAEFSEKENGKKNNTVLLYSLYRKSLHASLVPMFSFLDLFFGINIRDDYIETNMFNYLLEGNEMVFVFIYNNLLQAIRVDYSKKLNIFKKYEDFRELGYYSTKLTNCKKPKFMQSTYINTTIQYTQKEKEENNKLNKKYILEKDIASIISCEDDQGNINYLPKLIELPQCLTDLDDLNGHSIHKINFYLSVGLIIYDIFADIRLKSFRNVGIMFYPIEHNYKGLITYYIMIKNKPKLIAPKENTIYYDISFIFFRRLRPRYIPYFTKQFHLKYRLFKTESNDQLTINKISSSVCYFQIKFFPWDNTKINNQQNPNEIITFNSQEIINPEGNDTYVYYNPEEEEKDSDDICNIPECSICTKTDEKTNYNNFICEKCDNSELSVMIPDTNIKSETYGACICNTSLGFKKDPIINTCFCQEDYAYYKSTNLCWPLNILENGPYYTDKVDDITEIPIYDDCYFSCAKCSQGGNDTNHNCDECIEGFVHIDDENYDKNNCYNKSELNDGYHEKDKDTYIKCHENCISCTQKPQGDKQYCTECRNNVSFYIRENPDDEYFNCFSQKCDLNDMLFAYDINSHECVKNCHNGVKPYNNAIICLLKCNNDFPFLDEDSQLCYQNCEKNPVNKNTNYEKLICTNEEDTLPECGNERKYKNKEGNCVPIPDKCLVVDSSTELCKICNEGYYPLKEEMNLDYFNCYKSIEEIIEVKNKSNYYLNETEKYWDECYHTCETCYGYGSENRQRCIKCKEHYYLQNYLLNNNYNSYNNCLLELTPNENCTSSQIDMYKYHDFCHLCKQGYSFVNGFEKCNLDKELSEGPYYYKFMKKKTGDNRDRELIFKVYFNCYKYCKSCKYPGDFYDNNCTSCLENLIFNPKSKFQNCIDPNDLIDDTTNVIHHIDNSETTEETEQTTNKNTDLNKIEKTDKIIDTNKMEKTDITSIEKTDKNKIESTDKNKIESSDKTDKSNLDNTDNNKNIDTDVNDIEKTEEIYDKEKDKENDKEKSSDDKNINLDTDFDSDLEDFNITESDLIQDSEENTWFNLGNNSFYIYKQGNCYLVFYHQELILTSSKSYCSKICPIWSVKHCPLKQYERFRTLSKKEFNSLLSQANDYSSIKNDVNIFITEEEEKIYFQITNNVSPSPKNMSYIDLTEYDSTIKSKYGYNLLIIKADLKRNDTQSTQVEYQFYNPNNFAEKVNLKKNLLNYYIRNLDNNDNTNDNSDNNNVKVNIDLPVNWTEKQLENINYLSEQNINAFDTSGEFYTDNCYQFTSSKGGDVFLTERKKEYYPDIALCEEGCAFIRYNSDTEKVTCKCDYKINSENYTNITFIKNTKDQKFLKDLVMENMQSMKCYKVIFKWINLKSNAGFFIMIIFLVLFFVSCVLYYTTGGFKFLNKFVKKSISDKGINDILKSSINSDDNGDNDKNIKKHVKFQGDVDDPDNKDKDKNKGGDNDDEDDKDKGKKKHHKRKKGGSSDDSFEKNKPGYDKDSMNSSVLKNDPNKGKNKPPKNNDDDGDSDDNDNDKNNEDGKDKDKKKGTKKKKKSMISDDSFEKNKPGYDKDSMNSSVLKNDSNKGKNKPHNNNDDDNNEDNKSDKDDDKSDENDKDDKNNEGDDKGKKKGTKKKKKSMISDDSFEKNKPGYDNDSMNSSVLKNDPNKPPKNNGDNDDNDEEDKNKKKGPKKKKKVIIIDDSFKKNKPGYDTDSMNSSVLKNDPNKPPKKDDKDSNDKDSNNPINNPNDDNNEEPKDNIEPKNEEEENNEEEKEDPKDPEKKDVNKKKKKKKHNDKISEGDIPGNDYDKDSNYSCLKNDGKNNPKNIKEDNEEENPNNIEIKKKKKKKPKKDGTLISDGLKPEDYSNDSMVSGAAALKQKFPDSSQDKSLISGKSKENKNDNFNNENDEEEINVGDISNIKGQLFRDESKNDEDIIKEMGDKDNKGEENIDINLNINDMTSNKGDDKNKKDNTNNNNNNKDADIINIKDIGDNDSLNLSKDSEKIPVKKEEKKEKKKKTESSFISKYSQVKKAKEEGFYDKDSDILRDDDSHISKNYDINDLISEKSDKPNPPKKSDNINNIEKDEKDEQMLNLQVFTENNNKNKIYQIGSVSGLYSSKGNMKSSGEDMNSNKISENKIEDEIKEEEEIEDKKDKKVNKVNMNKIIKENDEIISLDDFSEKYKSFISLYLSDLKKHHILYFSFSYSKADINNIFLKLSLFSISIVLYFSLNTIFMINSKMANAYFDMANSSPIYILINLILPYILCGLIILLLKTYIMPNSYVTKIIKTIQGEKNLKNSLGIDKLEEEIAKKKDIPKQQKKRIIKNHKSPMNSLDMRAQSEYKEEKDKVERKIVPLYLKHRKIVVVYFILGFVFLGINWYMMTSFCAIYKNTGVKLIVNSFVSLFASFVFPCILGLIPSLLGYLAKKSKSKIIFNIYKVINKVL